MRFWLRKYAGQFFELNICYFQLTLYPDCTISTTRHTKKEFVVALFSQQLPEILRKDMHIGWFGKIFQHGDCCKIDQHQ